jgi:hypothetical protein
MLCATRFESNAEIPAASKGEVTDRGRARSTTVVDGRGK